MKPLIVPLGTYKFKQEGRGNREQQKSRYAHSETDQTRPTHSLSEWSDEVSSQTGMGQVTASHVAGAVATYMEVLVDVEKASAGISPLNTGAEPTGFRAVRRMQAVSHPE
jgi:hypothetical protein